MPYPETATGFMVNDPKNYKNFTKGEFKLKTFEKYDVDIAIDACGVCASDKHMASGGWVGPENVPTPICVGHEIIGRVLKTGDSVTTLKVGDRVGVGAQVGADLTCDNCKADQENYCPNSMDTYGAKYPDGVISQGGYSSHIRCHEYFVFKIPDNIETAVAAPMLCAGITTYSPLVRLGAGPGKKVAICGLGGLGHFGVMWAVALGAEVYVLSHTEDKREDALKMGAKEFILTTKEGWNEKYKFKFDFILNTADAIHDFNLPDYFGTLKVMGRFHTVGFPDHDLKAFNAMDFAGNGCYFGASHLGNRPEMLAMLDLASKQNIKTWIQTLDISEENCKVAMKRIENVEPRYRTTLVNFDAVFGKRE